MIEQLLQPISDEDASGPNLEYDPEYQSLEELAQPRPERTLGAGVIASEPIEWQRIADQSKALLGRSKDLRLAVHWCAARLHLEGLSGWAEGIALIRAFLDHYWDVVHPRLDASENDDPTERINAVADLADHGRILVHLRNARLFNGVHPAHFSLRELRIMQGTLKVDPQESAGLPSQAAIEACVRECPIDALTSLHAVLAGAVADVKAIMQIFSERTPLSGPDLDTLLRDVYELQVFLRAALVERNVAPVDGDGAETDAPAEEATPVVAQSHRGIERPEDVRRALDQICDYYARVEPSSPVPLLLRRAQRLVGLDFAELLRELAPSGISELGVISGQDHRS